MSAKDRLHSLYLAALALPSDDLPDFLARECADTPELRTTLERMLAARRSGSDFMGSPSALTTILTPYTESHAGAVYGRYFTLDRIGEGGFGTVYLAEQREPVIRRVAIKVLREEHTSDDVLARFEAERQALAMMGHPHIAKILDAGSDDRGRPFFVMELVAGTPITQYCDEHRLSIRERLELFEQVCHAAQHAHAKGVIHRDLKPSNMLVSTRDGKPHATVIDFGIAKATQGRLTPKPLFTADRAFMGTPEYMSPEQVAGSHDIDTRTDIYSLGVMLYELLTGVTPFGRPELRNAGVIEIVRQIRDIDAPRPSTVVAKARTDSPPTARSAPGVTEWSIARVASSRRTEPRQLASAIRGELDVIVMKALEKRPSDRYATADAMAADIRAYLSGHPISAVPHSAWYWMSKAIRRHRAIFAVASASLVALIAAMIIAFVGWTSADKSAKEAFNAKTKLAEALADAESKTKAAEEAENAALLSERAAQEARIAAERRAYESVIRTAEVSLLWDDRDSLRDALEDAVRERRGWEWHYLATQLDRSILTLAGHRAGVTDVAFDPHGAFVATTSFDGEVRLFDITSGDLTARFSHPEDAELLALAMSHDRSRIYTGSAAGVVRAWDVATREFLGTLYVARDATAIPHLVLAPDGRSLAAGCSNGRVVLVPVEPGSAQVRTLAAHTNPITSIVFSHDGSRVITTASESRATVWNVASGEKSHLDGGSSGVFVAAALLPDNERAVTLEEGGRIVRIRSIAGDEVLARFDLDRDETVDCVAVSGDGRLIAVAGSGGIYLLDTHRPGLERARLHGHRGRVYAVRFSRDSRLLATAGADATARIWDALETNNPARVAASFAGSARPLARDGKRLVLVDQHQVEIRDLTTGHTLTRITPDGFSPGAVSFTPDDSHVLVHALTEHELPTGEGAIFDAWTGALVAQLQPLRSMPSISVDEPLINPQGFHSVSFSPTGDRLVAPARGGKAEVYDWRTNARLFPLVGHDKAVLGVLFSPDGTIILTYSDDGTARLWKAATGEHIATLARHRSSVRDAIFSQDSGTVATLALDGVLRSWRTRDGARIGETTLHSLALSMMAVSDDGARVLLDDGEALRLVNMLDGSFASLPINVSGGPFTLTPTWDRIATLSRSDRIHIWSTESGRQLLTLRVRGHAVDAMIFALNGAMLVCSASGDTRTWDSRTAPERSATIQRFSLMKDAMRAHLAAPLSGGASFESARTDIARSPVLTDEQRWAALALLTEAQPRKGPDESEADSRADPRTLAHAEVERAAAAVERDADPVTLSRLGIAHFRARQYTQALDALQRSERMALSNREPDDPSEGVFMPANGAYIAMSHWRLGDANAARHVIEQLESLFREHHRDCDCIENLLMARSLMQSEPPGRDAPPPSRKGPQ